MATCSGGDYNLHQSDGPNMLCERAVCARARACVRVCVRICVIYRLSIAVSGGF
jgi:hypothetical protein